ncbi:MAG: hypothetical protein MK238_04705 [Nitrospinales bacterium]|nr:hypothetical protein [Nitrospinales bacterium]
MVKVVKGTLKKMKPLKASEYDGVLGMPPSWVPEPEKRRFFAARIALIEKYPEKEIRKLIASRKRTQRKGFTQTLLVPPELEDKVDTLIDIKKLVDLGEEKGLKQILGEERSAHQSRGKKVLNSAKKGHVATHGTEQEKKERWAKMQTEINKLHNKKPHLTYTSLLEIAAKKFNVTPKTIQRHTTNPHKK